MWHPSAKWREDIKAQGVWDPLWVKVDHSRFLFVPQAGLATAERRENLCFALTRRRLLSWSCRGVKQETGSPLKSSLYTTHTLRCNNSYITQ